MVLVFAESPRGQFKKAAFEAVTYGKKVADMLGTTCAALSLGSAKDAGELGRYGASRVLQVSDAAFDQFDSQAYAAAIAEVVNSKEVSDAITADGSVPYGSTPQQFRDAINRNAPAFQKIARESNMSL